MGCFTLLKITMFLLNILIFLAGLSLLTVGIWASVDGSYFLRMLAPFSRHTINVRILCAVLGAGLLMLGLLGGGGAIQQSKCQLLAVSATAQFFSVVLAVFVANVASGVVTLAYSSFAEGIMRALATAMLREDYGTEPMVTKVWNATMSELACCGYSSYADFQLTAGMFHPSCCLNSTPCNLAEAARSNVKGCFQAILEMLTEHANIVGGIAVGIGILEIATMTISMFLYCHLDNNDD